MTAVIQGLCSAACAQALDFSIISTPYLHRLPNENDEMNFSQSDVVDAFMSASPTPAAL